MTNKSPALKLLKKVFHHENADYSTDYSGEVGYKTDCLSAKDMKVLQDADLFPNTFEARTHDELLAGLLAMKSNTALTDDLCKALFLKGLSGSEPRFRQSLISYMYLETLEPHKFQASDTTSNCAICGLPRKSVQDRTHTLYTYHLGHSWNESPQGFLAELEEILTYPEPDVSKEDKSRLKDLLKLIAQAEPGETPGQLEKRIAKAKLLPKTDKYKRYGILQTLAIMGILPSDPAIDNQPARSDIVMPLAGWSGRMGVDFDKAVQAFDLTF